MQYGQAPASGLKQSLLFPETRPTLVFTPDHKNVMDFVQGPKLRDNVFQLLPHHAHVRIIFPLK